MKWEANYSNSRSILFKKIKDPDNFEYWLRVWINICCEMKEYSFATFLAQNAYLLLQKVKGGNPNFIKNLKEFLNQ